MPRRKRSRRKEPGTQKNDIFVGIPRERFFYPEFVDNRDNLLGYLQSQGRYGGHYHVESHRVDMNRQRIVEEFYRDERGLNPEWLLMIDTDMEHHVEIGIRLAKWKKPIVGGLYFHRNDHEPLAFYKTNIAEDKYGRLAQNWRPARDEVYDFLTRNKFPMQDGGCIIDDMLGNPLLPVDAMGTGAIIIHKSVLDKVGGPWFSYTDPTQSEDLLFCLEAQKHGFNSFVDMSTISGHYRLVPMGQAQFRMRFEGRGLSLATPNNTDNVKEWMSEFGWNKRSVEKALREYHPDQMAALWADVDPNDPEQVTDFYLSADVGRLYILDLLKWNRSQFFEALRKPLMRYREKEVLEIGGGIGTTSIQMAIQRCNVQMVEPNDILRSFAEYRWEWLKPFLECQYGEIRFLKSIHQAKPGVDIAVGIDVFEHLHPSALPLLIDDVSFRVKRTGKLYVHNNFEQQDLFPFHFDHSLDWDEYVENAGFLRTDEQWHIKTR
jgi:hypothetical protein